MSKEKNVGVEFIRLCATIGVIMNHVGVCWISAYGDTANANGLVLFKTINGLAFWPVPCFMMITGFLLLSRQPIDYNKAFCYFKRIAILLALFGTLFASMELFFKTKSLTLDLFVNSFVDMIQGKTWNHLWYLYMLLGIYLILPIFSWKNTPPHSKQLLILLLIIFFFTSILPCVKQDIGIVFPLSSVYVGYLLLGYFLSIEEVKDWCSCYLKDEYCVFIILFLFALVVIEYVFDIQFRFSGYTLPFTVMQVTLMFVMAMRQRKMIDKICCNPLVKNFNRCSLGIYIIHMVWINLIIKVLHVNIMGLNILMILMASLAIVILSWMSVNVLIRVPILKKYL